MTHSLLILGKGYIGSAYASFVKTTYPNLSVTASTRTTINTDELIFCMQDKTTWKNIPKSSHILWTFPAAQTLNDIALCQEFYMTCCSHAKVIVLGSTSSYISTTAGATVDETTPLNLKDPRTCAEEWLRNRGAVLLRLAGIFGPERDPLQWLLQGRIQNGLRLANLIHRDDITFAIQTFVTQPKPGECYILTSGKIHTWNAIAEAFKNARKLPKNFELKQKTDDIKSKLILNTKVQKLLGTEYKFRTLV